MAGGPEFLVPCPVRGGECLPGCDNRDSLKAVLGRPTKTEKPTDQVAEDFSTKDSSQRRRITSVYPNGTLSSLTALESNCEIAKKEARKTDKG